MSLELHGFRTISIHFYGLNQAPIKIDKVSYKLLDFVTLEQLRSNDDIPIFFAPDQFKQTEKNHMETENSSQMNYLLVLGVIQASITVLIVIYLCYGKVRNNTTKQQLPVESDVQQMQL